MNILDWMNAPGGYVCRHTDMPAQRQTQAKTLCWEYNRTAPLEGEKRAKILQQLLGTCHSLTFIEPDFRCDYGFNIHTHGLTVINYNCASFWTPPGWRSVPAPLSGRAAVWPVPVTRWMPHSALMASAPPVPSRWEKTSGWERMSLSAAVYPSVMAASSGLAAWSPGIFPPVWLPPATPAKCCVPSRKPTA